MKKYLSVRWVILSLVGAIFAGDDLLVKSGTVNVEDFTCEKTATKGIPSGWQASRKECSMFSVVRDQSGCFLRLTVDKECTSIGKQVSFSTDSLPILSWKWRVHTLPVGGCEYKKETNDSGAGVYVIFKGRLKLNKILKYVWSTTLPPGTILASPFNKNTKVIVLQSGKEKTGRWVTETVNLREDFLKAFNTSPPSVIGIAILSDADNTGSRAVADYDEFCLKVKEHSDGISRM
ncbi:MAG TPA: DUF3047 domain-containing protein [Chitinispirillaceae bacterium]|nr:DUF3047 domain-containing protein [Chitinispirillaceae bacterium]